MRFNFTSLDADTQTQWQSVSQMLSNLSRMPNYSETDRKAARDAYVALHYLMQPPEYEVVKTSKKDYVREDEASEGGDAG